MTASRAPAPHSPQAPNANASGGAMPRALAALTFTATAVALILAGCGGLPPETEPEGAVVVFAAFDGPEEDAPTISSVATVIIGGVRGRFDGPSEKELILRGIPFGSQDPPQQPMTVTAPGYKTASQQLQLRKDMATFVDLTMESVDLTQTGTVEGTVRSEAGDPITNAHVTFTPQNGDLEASVAGFTDSDGSFIIGGIPVGPTVVEAAAAGFLTETQHITIQPDDGGTNPELSFALLSGSTTVTVRGIVKDLRLESPLEGAQVTVADMPPTTTATDGTFVVPDVLVGTQTITVTLSGYDDYEDDIEVLPGMSDLQILMSAVSSEPPGVPYTITGTVNLLGRSDNSGALVTAYDLIRQVQMDSYQTGADGRYYLFVPGGSYEITVTFEGKSISRDLDYPGGGRIFEGIDFTLTP